jgi:uncharacterized cupin superfamily protein
MAERSASFIRAAEVPTRTGSNYPSTLAGVVAGRGKRALGDAFGLDQFGVNLTTLGPGASSSHRHWHEREDEFIYVLGGEITLIDDTGEHALTPGTCAGFKAGVANGHCLINRSKAPASYLEIGTRLPEERSTYPDIDLKGVKTNSKWTFTKRDGSAF